MANYNSVEVPSEADSFYSELTSRNKHFIDAEVQSRIRSLKMLIAGCGSTGGACIEALARLGVERFILADNGDYELTNLNRQHALLKDIGTNKAVFHASQLKQINPFISVKVYDCGLNSENTAEAVEWADLIMDGVDVTSPDGMRAKLELHVVARDLEKPVFTGLDMGFCQWGKSYDYRDPEMKVLDGCLERAMSARHPLKALFSIVPLEAVPDHSLQLIMDLLEDEVQPASQLGAASDLLSGIIVAAVVRYAESSEIVPGWNINLEEMAHPEQKRNRNSMRAHLLREKVRARIEKIE